MNLTPGRYSCVVLEPSNGWLFEAGERNTPYIGIPLRVTSGAKEGETVEYKAWISDAAFDRTIANLKEVFEWDGDMVKLAKQLDTGHFVGRECSITVEQEEYKGKLRNVIKWLNGPDGGGKAMESDRALKLAKRLMGRDESTQAEAPDDQDIPFE